MYRKIVWCYAFILTFLDITLNTKLTAQGKSHGKIDITCLKYFELFAFMCTRHTYFPGDLL